jgi:hypothetical protein
LRNDEAHTERVRRPSRSLQPRQWDIDDDCDDSAFLADLQRVEVRSQADRIERLLADAELINTLQYLNFDPTSKEWHEVSAACAEYGYSVFVGWGRAGLLRTMAHRHGGTGVYGAARIPEGQVLDLDQAHELSAELMIKAIEAFRTRTLMNPDPTKRWRPEGGASLRTYFIGRCLLELPGIYVRWDRQRRRSRNQLTDDIEVWEDTLNDDGYQRDTIPHSQALAAALLEEIARHDPAVTMFRLQDAGYSYDEIAQILTDAGSDTTPSMVRTRMSRLRGRMKEGTGVAQ